MHEGQSGLRNETLGGDIKLREKGWADVEGVTICGEHDDGIRGVRDERTEATLGGLGRVEGVGPRHLSA